MKPWLCIIMLMATPAMYAQSTYPYYLNGSATQENCHCYTLTPDSNDLAGSVWNINKIDLRSPIHFTFSVFLGNNRDGADGIAFILQPISTSVGTSGGGLGFQHVKPGIGILVDTWKNPEFNDPDYDHISIHRDGDVDHLSPNNLAGPVTALASGANIDDGKWHAMDINWNPSSMQLSCSMDGQLRVSVTLDLVNNVFGGDPFVFWGFSGATGNATNLQRFCTSLNPVIATPSRLNTCIGNAIPFSDSSTAFSRIDKWYWNFGDGTRDTVQTPAPHVYAQPGYYDVALNILGIDGCLSDTFHKKILVGSIPSPGYGLDSAGPCEGTPLRFLDSSIVQFGTLTRWNWNIDGQAYQQKNPVLPNGLSQGPHAVSLQVGTAEGCLSGIFSKPFVIKQLPDISLALNDICVGQTALLQAMNRNPQVQVSTWSWDLGNGLAGNNSPVIQYAYPRSGTYLISVRATSTDGCTSRPVTGSLVVTANKTFAGNDTIIATGQSFQLHAVGGDYFQWSPATGLSDPAIPDPVVTLQGDARYVLTATTQSGCVARDSIYIRVFKGPEIYVPSAFTPNHDGLNDLLKVYPAGITLEYFRIFDRWGNMVFQTSDFRNGWDGRVKAGSPASSVFSWIVRGSDSSGKIIMKKGSVTVIR